MYSIYICDTETTGLIPDQHDVIEVCFWRLSDDQSKTWWMKPLKPENITDAALKINGHKKEDILGISKEGKEKYLDPKIVLPEIEMWIMEDGASSEDRIFVGQNPWFDFDFLTNLWGRINSSETFPFGIFDGRDRINNPYGRYHQAFVLDTLQLVRFVDAMTGKKRAKYSLSSLVKDFGITKATAHRADGDVKMTKDLFLQLFNAFKDKASEEFERTYK